MSIEHGIIVEGLSKRFRRPGANRPGTLKEAIFSGFRGLRPEYFWGLREVSFRVAQGRTVGIIGANGAGKSTLLRLIGGVGRPDRGRIQVAGRIGALLDLGAGFHPDLTGRENLRLAGLINGLTRREVEARFAQIVAFAELEQFIESPLRTYSTGMQMRLAFAVAVHSEPQLLLVDEVLAVGDIAFQRKCLRRIAEFRDAGCTILIVSHDPGQIRELCDEVIWLRKGQVVAHGPAALVVDQYVEEGSAPPRRRTPAASPEPAGAGARLQLNQNRFGSLEQEITAVRLRDAAGLPVRSLPSGSALRVEIDYRRPAGAPMAIVGVSISSADGQICYDVNTDGVDLPAEGVEASLALDLQRLDLAGGEYFINVGLYEPGWAYAYDYHWQAYPLTIDSRRSHKGLLSPPARWSSVDAQATSPA